MIKKYYSIILIAISILVVLFINKYEIKTNEKNINKQQNIKDEEKLIIEKILPKTKLILKEEIKIKRGENCKWLVKDTTACGIYINKRFFTKTLSKGTELNIEWVTNKRYLLPGLVFSLEDQDTIISTKTDSALDVYIVLIQGENLEILRDKNKSNYNGSSLRPATIIDLQKFFEIIQD
jgi:hypothetical protein